MLALFPARFAARSGSRVRASSGSLISQREGAYAEVAFWSIVPIVLYVLRRHGRDHAGHPRHRRRTRQLGWPSGLEGFSLAKWIGLGLAIAALAIGARGRTEPVAGLAAAGVPRLMALRGQIIIAVLLVGLARRTLWGSRSSDRRRPRRGCRRWASCSDRNAAHGSYLRRSYIVGGLLCLAAYRWGSGDGRPRRFRRSVALPTFCLGERFLVMAGMGWCLLPGRLGGDGLVDVDRRQSPACCGRCFLSRRRSEGSRGAPCSP